MIYIFNNVEISKSPQQLIKYMAITRFINLIDLLIKNSITKEKAS